jgi:xanthine/CO dehydrogenase XdhC/CoxF family maturation factor
LIERGVDSERLVELTCPIGVSGIVDKAPTSIAVAVCAELLQVRSRAASAQPLQIEKTGAPGALCVSL